MIRKKKEDERRLLDFDILTNRLIFLFRKWECNLSSACFAIVELYFLGDVLESIVNSGRLGMVLENDLLFVLWKLGYFSKWRSGACLTSMIVHLVNYTR